MWFGMVSLFPEAFKAVTDFGITGRAIDAGVIEMAYFNHARINLSLIHI